MSAAGVEWARPSDAERDRALAVLRDGAGSGRLSHDTFIRRMNFVLRAQSRGELADVLRDLPRAEPPHTSWLRAKLQRFTNSLRPAVPRLSPPRATAAVPALALPEPGSPTVRIGRFPGATLRLGDVTVSRFHAELRHVGDAWMLRDLGSMNGTCVNDLRITTTVRVRPGDRVSFGAVVFTLTYRGQ